MNIQSFRQVGLTLKIDGSDDSEIQVKDLPNLIVGNRKKGGLGCNQDR